MISRKGRGSQASSIASSPFQLHNGSESLQKPIRPEKLFFIAIFVLLSDSQPIYSRSYSSNDWRDCSTLLRNELPYMGAKTPTLFHTREFHRQANISYRSRGNLFQIPFGKVYMLDIVRSFQRPSLRV